MGALMGVMMLWMLHGAISGGNTVGAMALIGFIGAHVALLLIALGAGVFAARMSPRLQGWIDQMHKPSLPHVGAMFGTAVVFIGVVHLAGHGLGGV